MKPATLLLSAFIFLFPLIVTAQIKNKVKSETPCCSILSIGPVDGVVQPNGVGPVDGITLVRDNTTGKTFIFIADALDKNNLHVGDAISADMATNKITGIKGTARNYTVSEMKPIEPCCGITNIQQGTPCCNLVNVESNGTTYSFSVPKAVSNTLKVGQPVFMAMQNSYAFFQVNTNGSMATYSYPAQGNVAMSPKNDSIHRSIKLPDGTSSGTNGGMTRETMSDKTWDLQTDPSLKGLSGTVAMQIPKEIRFNTHLKFFNAGDTKKVVASWFGNNKANLLPGEYDVVVDDKYTIKNVPVEKGKQTTLLMGVLQWSGYGTVTLENEDHQKFSYAAPFKIVLPQGTYSIVGKKSPNTLTITNGNLTAL